MHSDTKHLHLQCQDQACDKGGKWQLAVSRLAGMAESPVQQGTINLQLHVHRLCKQPASFIPKAIAALRSALVKMSVHGSWQWACWPRWLRAQCHKTQAVAVQRSDNVKRVANGTWHWAGWPRWMRAQCNRSLSVETRWLKAQCNRIGPVGQDGWEHSAFNQLPSAISACKNVGKLQLALGLLPEMVENTVQNDTIIYSAAINACGNNVKSQLAQGQLAKMAENTAHQDTINGSARISACEKSGVWQLALGLLSEMECTQTPLSASLPAGIGLVCQDG